MIVNPNDYDVKNYNCFLSAYNISTGQEFKEYENGPLLGRFDQLSPNDFTTYIKAGYEKVGNESKVFGSTVVAFRGYNITKSWGGLITEKTLDLNHAAIYIGTSRNGTEWTFSKNGDYKPEVRTTNSLKHIYGHKVGYWNRSKN